VNGEGVCVLDDVAYDGGICCWVYDDDDSGDDDEAGGLELDQEGARANGPGILPPSPCRGSQNPIFLSFSLVLPELETPPVNPLDDDLEPCGVDLVVDVDIDVDIDVDVVGDPVANKFFRGIGGGPIEFFLLPEPELEPGPGAGPERVGLSRGDEGGVGWGVPLVLDVGNGEVPSSPSSSSIPIPIPRLSLSFSFSATSTPRACACACALSSVWDSEDLDASPPLI
jgi:hypothetical protein